MSAEPTPILLPKVRKAVARLAEQGFRVLRVHPNDKRPVDPGWPEKATDDPNILDPWFNAEYNIGVACGPQPNGINLVVIDVDTRDDGLQRWTDLVAEHGIPTTRTHRTPSGGLHVFFNAPVALTNSKLAPGIDVRGLGGQVVMPPSGRYVEGVWTEYVEIGGPNDVAPMTDWLVERLVKPQIERAIERHPSQPSTQGGEFQTNADWFGDHFDFLADLEGQGYTVVGQRGDEIYLRHPTATSEKSCTLHVADNFLYAYSSNMPSPLRTAQIGRDGNTGWSAYDWWVRTTFDGDYSEATREVNRRRSPLQARTAERAGPTVLAELDDTPLNLPADFWAARPVLARIRQAAWSAGCSPDALLVQTLARVATYVHPCYKLPGVKEGLIGKHQTFDFLGCVIAETSGGKTMAAGVGEDFVPAPEDPTDGSDPKIDFEQKVGSGEGIAEFFLVPQLIEDPDSGRMKPTGKKVIGKQALFMNVDEGTGFTNQADRKGTTIVSALASAWSGESLGALNASTETRRLVRGGRVRICAVINMQDTNGYLLFTPDLASVGFTGRLLFASAHDPQAPPPDEQPMWPGPLAWIPPAGNTITNRYLTYDPAISIEIKNTRWGVLTKQVAIDQLQSQYLLLRCKVAALLAILDDRLHVTADDWALATQIIAMSSACLRHLTATHSFQQEVTAVTAAAFRMKVAESASSMHVRQLIPGWQAKILARLRKRGPLPWKGLKDIVDADRRKELREVLGEMVSEGLLILDGARYRPA